MYASMLMINIRRKYVENFKCCFSFAFLLGRKYTSESSKSIRRKTRRGHTRYILNEHNFGKRRNVVLSYSGPGAYELRKSQSARTATTETVKVKQ